MKYQITLDTSKNIFEKLPVIEAPSPKEAAEIYAGCPVERHQGDDKMTITTNYPKNFTKAENDVFSWNDSYGDYLLHKASKRSIYQMRWTDTKEPVEPEIKEAAKAFWAELDALKKAEQESKWSDASLKNWNSEREAYSGEKSLIDDMDSADSDY